MATKDTLREISETPVVTRTHTWNGKTYPWELFNRFHTSSYCLLLYLGRYQDLSDDVKSSTVHLISGISRTLADSLIWKLSEQVVIPIAVRASLDLECFLTSKEESDRIAAMIYLKRIRNLLGLDQFHSVDGRERSNLRELLNQADV